MQNNERPLVSICCITYNHEPYIRDCLEGFVMQRTNFPFEVLIHDDASTDRTADIIREYEAKYPDIIKPIYQTENQYSRGKSIWGEFQFPFARGKYIALCEGDDFWTDPRKLQIQYDYMEAHPECSLCFHRVNVLFDNSSQDVPLFKQIEERDYSFEDAKIPTCSVFFRNMEERSHLGQLLSGTNIKLAFGDVFVWGIMSQYGTLHALSRSMATYRKHQGGVTCTKEWGTDISLVETWLYFLQCVPSKFQFVKKTISGNIKRQIWLMLKHKQNSAHAIHALVYHSLGGRKAFEVYSYCFFSGICNVIRKIGR